MNRARAIVGLVAAAGLAAGCSTSLEVRVDILDSRAWHDPAVQEYEFKEQLKEVAEFVGASARERTGLVERALQPFRDLTACAVKHNYMGGTSRDALLSEIEAEVTEAWDEGVVELQEALARGLEVDKLRKQAVATRQRPDEDVIAAKMAAAQQKLAAGAATINSIPPRVTAKADELILQIRRAVEPEETEGNAEASSSAASNLAALRDCLSGVRTNIGLSDRASRITLTPSVSPADVVDLADKTAARAGAALAEQIAGLTGDLDILGDPQASLAINAPAHYWQGVYNEAYGGGGPGNIDVAIVMNKIGSFSVKGLRHDTGAVTAATFEVLRQTIRVAAAAGGVPIPITGTPAPEGEAAATEATDPLTALRVAAARETQAAETRELAVAAFLRASLGGGNGAALDGTDDAARSTAVAHARNMFQVLQQSVDEDVDGP